MGPADIFKPDDDLSEFDRLLLDLYRKSGTSVDYLAYTPEFDRIYDQLVEAGDKRSKQEVFRRLLNLRKAGVLPRVA